MTKTEFLKVYPKSDEYSLPQLAVDILGIMNGFGQPGFMPIVEGIRQIQDDRALEIELVEGVDKQIALARLSLIPQVTIEKVM